MMDLILIVQHPVLFAMEILKKTIENTIKDEQDWVTFTYYLKYQNAFQYGIQIVLVKAQKQAR